MRSPAQSEPLRPRGANQIKPESTEEIMSIKLNTGQKEQLFANHADVMAQGAASFLTMKPAFAIFTPPVSQLLSTLERHQHLRPDDMLVAYSANCARPDALLCLLQQVDRFCVFGFFNLTMYLERARASGKAAELLDLAVDSVELNTAISVLNPFTAHGSRVDDSASERTREFELVLTLPPSSSVQGAAHRPSVHLYEMDDRRLNELRSEAAQERVRARSCRHRRLY